MTIQPTRALPRPQPFFSTVVRALAIVVVLVLAATFLQAGRPAAAAVVDLDRRAVVNAMLSGGPSVRRAAEAALIGSDADLRSFVTDGKAAALQADQASAARVLAGLDGPAMKAAATQALAGTPADLKAFVDGGWQASWDADERVRAYRVLEAGGPNTKAAAQTALAGTSEQLSEFLSTGRDKAGRADDRLAATRMLTGAANNSGPVLDAAAQRALGGTPDELREFLETGQYVARARDAELASIRSLTEQAKQAGEETARESLAAAEASTRAVNAAEQAKRSAQIAAQESAAAGGSAAKASAAAGRAADAAAGAAAAAKDAISASNAAMRAARIAADAARKATTAASLTAEAAARAQRAAAAARTDADKAAAAREAAQAARDAAAKARELEQVKAERDRALAQALAASNAAKSAGGQADEAARAADEAGNQSGVSAQQAARARAAADDAHRAAAAADRAADRALALAQAAAEASDEAFRFAAQAAEHAEAAAAAAEDAANHAGDASRAAAESTRHAAAAVAAANLAVEAANQAVRLEQLARDEDVARLAESTEQGVMAAQDALAEEQAEAATAGELIAWNKSLTWDTAEEDRIDPASRALLTEATAAGASPAVVLDRGRRAAIALATTGGEWSSAAAKEAVGGGEVELRSWLTEGRAFAAGQDDRARLWHLVDTLPAGAEKTAGQTALSGADAAVQQFLRTRSYPGKVAKDRQAIYAMLPTAGPNVTTAANRALAGTAADLHAFLRAGQYSARAADERLEAYRVMDAGGPEVKAAAQVALAGPRSYVSYFLQVSRYQAAQRDVEQATHVTAVRALIQQAQQYAQTALSDAAEASRVAAVANNAAADAQRWAAEAAASAAKAADYASQAQQSAAAAQESANSAAQSAQTARNAANSAQASAAQASQSAATATAASRRAAVDAQAAYQAKQDARVAADAAGRDAAAADLLAKEAASIYAQKLEIYESRNRSTAAGSGAGGTGTAAGDHRTWSCLDPTQVSTECLKVYTDFAGALMNPAKCAAPANSGTSGCLMLNDLNSFVKDNPELILDMLQFVLMGCGLIPGAGEVCDGIDAAISFGRGDWVGGLLSLGAMVPVAGYLASAAKGGRAADKLRNIQKIVEALAKGCKRSSFVPGTRVLLAGGGSERIERLRVGDQVLATDTVTGQTRPQAVAATITSAGAKKLVDIKVDADGAAGRATATITATDSHPFWVPRLQTWVAAGSLQAGQKLRDATGATVRIESVSRRTERTRVHNLTIAGFHTYYVAAGGTSALVHNCGIDEDMFDDISRAYSPNIADGVDYNFKRMCPTCNPDPASAADHSIAGIGSNAPELARYLAQPRTFTHVDPRSGARIAYDPTRVDSAGRGVVIIQNAYMTHAYHLSQSQFDQLYRLRE